MWDRDILDTTGTIVRYLLGDCLDVRQLFRLKPGEEMKFSGVMIGSEDPHALGAFYTSVLGEPGFHDGSWYGWGKEATLMLGAHSEVHGKSATPHRIMLSIEVADVNEAFATLVGLSAKVIAEPYKPEADQDFLLATVEDPDGNYVQLAPPWD
jgi:predicted enzyme related to lactoylglutathione lyase